MSILTDYITSANKYRARLAEMTIEELKIEESNDKSTFSEKRRMVRQEIDSRS